MIELPKPRCVRCQHTPDELSEYVVAAAEAQMTPDAYVRAEEGTYNPKNGHFACTECYLAIGMPTAPGAGWKAP